MEYVLPMLFVVFVALKLMGAIDWSWWLVFAPLYPAIIIWTVFAAIVWRVTR